MKPMPEAKFNESLQNLKYYGFIQDDLDGGVSITEKGDAYLERLMLEKSEMFVLLFLFYLQSTEENR